MEVALEPPTLGVAGLRDPRARRLDLGELQAQLNTQARELDRDGRGVEHRAQQVRALRKRGIVQQHADLVLAARDRRPRPAVVGERLEHGAAPVGVGAGLGQREQHLGISVTERQPDSRADVLRLRVAVADVVEEAAQQPHALIALAREAPVDDRLQAVA